MTQIQSRPDRKSVRRILMLNWARYQKLDVRLNGSAFLTGVNTAGKSTVLDALTFLLTGNRQFNKAAKDKERTVLRYVRGDTSARGEEDRFLRSGQIVSYIAMEFDSPSDGEPFVVMVCTESPNETVCTSSWYVGHNAVMDDFDFYTETEGKRKVTPMNQLSCKGVRIRPGEWKSVMTGCAQVLRAMGLRADVEEYRRKLVKMIAFNPDNNISQFIEECVLEEKKIDALKALRENRHNYEEAQQAYLGMAEQKRLLEELENFAGAYEKRETQLQVLGLMEGYQAWQEALKQKTENEEELSRLSDTVKSLKGQSRRLEDEQAQAQEAYVRARGQDVLQNVASALSDLEKEEKEITDRKEELETETSRLLKLQLLLQRELKWLVEETGDPKMPAFAASLAGTGVSAEEKAAGFARLSRMAENRLSQLQREDVHLEDEISSARGELDALRQEIRDLERNRLPVPKDIREDMNLLQEEMKKQGAEGEVRTFAELVEEMTDESWRPAVETLLGWRRHDLIVDGPMYATALQIQEKLHLKHATLVMTDRLDKSGAEPGSAASLLKIPNPYARRYADYLLGRVHLCETLEELHDHPLGGIMRSGLRSRGYTSGFMDMKDTRFCLGARALQLQLEQVKKLEAARAQDIKELMRDRELNREKQAGLKQADWQASAYDFDSPSALEAVRSRLQEVIRQKDMLTNDPNYATAMDLLNQAKARLERAQKALQDLNSRLMVCETDMERCEQAQPGLKQKADEGEAAYSQVRSGHPELEGRMKEEYEKRRARRGSMPVLTAQDMELARRRLQEALKVMEDGQLEYLRCAGMEVSMRGAGQIPFFRDKLRDLKNVRIEEARERVNHARASLQSAFLTDFVGAINENITSARRELELLNQELKLLPFGNDVYRFSVTNRADRAVFFRVCDRLRLYLYQPEYYEHAAEDEEYQHDVETLMEMILDENREDEFVDYRRYLTYDMEITTTQGDKQIVTTLSRKHGMASGGEKQTPYYIILLAALSQFYGRDVCCARLAFIDEAFSAMSDDRVEQMVRFFEQNGIQAFYSAPPKMAASIGAHIGTVVSLVQSGRFTQAVEGLIRADDIY